MDEDHIQLSGYRGEFVPGCPDFAGGCFGISVEMRTKESHGTDSPLYHLYVEDDGYWHHKTSFDRLWANDLIAQLNAAEEATTNATHV